MKAAGIIPAAFSIKGGFPYETDTQRKNHQRPRPLCRGRIVHMVLHPAFLGRIPCGERRGNPVQPLPDSRRHLVCPLAQPYGAGKTCKTPARPAAVLLGHLSGVLRLGSFFDRLHAVAHALALRQRDGCYFRLQGGVAGAH